MKLSPESDKSNRNISVVMCTFNGERYLGEQLQSISEQTMLPAELVVCDDQSSDRTIQILEEFSESVPFSVRIYQNRSRVGSTVNFDHALKLACGELIALSDQDDKWVPHKLERLSTILVGRPDAGGVFSDASLIDSASRPIDGSLFAKHKFTRAKRTSFLADPISILLKHSVVCGATLMLRAAVVRSMPPIPASWVHDGWLAWMVVLNSKLAFSSERLMEYRVHDGQQIGLCPRNTSANTAVNQEPLRTYYQRVANQFAELLNHVEESDLPSRDRFVTEIKEKIAFLQRESSLSRRSTMRALELAWLFPKYMRYSRGLGTIRQDAFMQ
ncbi:MAG TPA: glycosyltransferase [Terracidiphilus sp.]|nr:glycosyltransferase [Terracidiphilus sp.]